MGRFIGPILYKAAEGLFGEGVFYCLLAISGIIIAVWILNAIISIANKSNDSDGNDSKTRASVEYFNEKTNSSTSFSGPIVFLLIVFLPIILLMLYNYLSN